MDNTLGNALVVEAVDLTLLLLGLGGGVWSAYLLTSEVIL